MDPAAESKLYETFSAILKGLYAEMYRNQAEWYKEGQ
jgi:hypothetical protein